MRTEPATIAALAQTLAGRTVTAEEVTRRCLDAIAERNPLLNAFISVQADAAMDEARQADLDIASGRSRGPLHGVPISVKDLIDVAGVPTTAASRLRLGHVAARDATVVERLRAAGAIPIGKTNLHEFALGTTNEDSAFGPARHPLDASRSPGGSSGGSAASVAASMAWASIGTDTGGSVRIPAAACGLIGLKPALGEIPMDGIVPLSTTLDYVGPICRSVEDAHLLHHALRGEPAAASMQAQRARGLRLRLLRSFFMDVLDAGVATAFDAACARLREAGVEIHDGAIPHAGDVESIYVHIALSEAASYHLAALERSPEDYTPNVRLRLEMGRYILAEDYVRALRGCDVLRAEVDAALHGYDGLLLPSLAIPAPRLGVATVRIGHSDIPVRTIMLRLTQVFNVTGHPAITVPCGTTPEGLPVGAQIAGRDTAALLQVAQSLESYLRPDMEVTDS